MYLRDPAILRGHRSHAKVQPLAGQREYLHFSVILRPLVLVRSRKSNPRPPAPQSSALPTELIRLRLKNIKSNLLSLWRLTVYCQEPIFWSLHLCYNFESTFPIFLFLKLIISREKLILRTSAQSHKEIKFPLCFFAVFLGKFTCVR